MRVKGFTLIEVMMALLLASILVVSISVALHHVISAQSVTKIHIHRLRSTQLALNQISEDLAHAVEQTMFDGQQRWPAFTGASDSMTFVRFGATGPLVVKYQFTHNILERGVLPFIDVKKADIHYVALLHSVAPLQELPVFKYLGEDLLFYDAWPAPANAFHSTLPRAVQVGFHIAGWGDITQLYLLANAVGLAYDY